MFLRCLPLFCLMAICGALSAQNAATCQAPWQRHGWTAQDVTIPLLREAIENANSQPDSADNLIAEARKHLGKPYRYGGKGPKVFDCAGFARYVYMQFGYSLPGSSGQQYQLGRHIKNTRKLQRGDLVFWQGRSGRGGVGHTGIVTEVDTATGVFRFIHAATSSGVIQSYSTEPYYSRRYIGATRLLGDRIKPEDPLPHTKRKKK